MSAPRLADVVAALGQAGQLVRAPREDFALLGVTDDSRGVREGYLFCAVEGSARDGHAFVEDAAHRGAAAALVTRHLPDVAIVQVLVGDSRVAAGVAAATWHGRPGDALRLVGVTGTNGKSTTVTLIRHLLNAEGRVGMLGTLGAVDSRGRSLPEGAGLTTPGPVELHLVLAELLIRGCDTVIMEASSHALHQRRLAGLTYAAGVYTNLTHDHLDYHGDPDAYLAAKLLLSGQLADGGAEVVNQDDPAWSALPRDARLRRVTFGLADDADVRASDVAHAAEGTDVTLHLGNSRSRCRLPLVGEFNVSNALGAAAAAWALGVDAKTVTERLAGAPQVPGRVERLAAMHGWVVLRDYAHTPDALAGVLQALRPLATGRLIALFGCGGDRDRTKRPVMGKIAARGADVVIVTSDNPRTEDPERILDDIEAGMEGAAHLRLVDRREAIHRALGMLEAGDCLVLAGKGHETYQIVGTERRPFDERTIVHDALGLSAA